MLTTFVYIKIVIIFATSITNNAAGRGTKRGNMITTAQVNFMIQSAMIIQNVSKIKATETVNKYITEKGWKIV